MKIQNYKQKFTRKLHGSSKYHIESYCFKVPLEWGGGWLKGSGVVAEPEELPPHTTSSAQHRLPEPNFSNHVKNINKTRQTLNPLAFTTFRSQAFQVMAEMIFGKTLIESKICLHHF